MTKASDVLKFLNDLGYTTSSNDEALVTDLIAGVENTIKNQCNISEMPDELTQVVIMRTSGAFLRIKSATCDLTTTFNLNAAYKKVTEGDVTVEFSVPDATSPQKLINDLISSLEGYGKRDVQSFRRISW